MGIKDKVLNINKLNIYLQSLFVFVVALSNPACALDNPDAADYIGELEQREKVYLESINNPDNTTMAFLIAYDDYQLFLDKELNQAYQLLKSKLPEARQKELIIAQRQWIKYRDAEFDLINNNWSRENFGSSAGISRGSYRSKIIKDRVLQLLQYAINY